MTGTVDTAVRVRYNSYDGTFTLHLPEVVALEVNPGQKTYTARRLSSCCAGRLDRRAPDSPPSCQTCHRFERVSPGGFLFAQKLPEAEDAFVEWLAALWADRRDPLEAVLFASELAAKVKACFEAATAAGWASAEHRLEEARERTYRQVCDGVAQSISTPLWGL